MKKTLLVVGAALALVVVLAFAVPTFAASQPTVASGQTAQQAFRPRALWNLLLIQNEARVDDLIAKAQESGKITADQALKIKTFWTEHHKQLARNVVLTRIIWARDGSKVQAFVDKAVAGGKMTQAQATRIMDFWNAVHSK
jgi:polyhydroxyalkanoate synthesis regulator phasin